MLRWWIHHQLATEQNETNCWCLMCQRCLSKNDAFYVWALKKKRVSVMWMFDIRCVCVCVCQCCDKYTPSLRLQSHFHECMTTTTETFIHHWTHLDHLDTTSTDKNKTLCVFGHQLEVTFNLLRLTANVSEFLCVLANLYTGPKSHMVVYLYVCVRVFGLFYNMHIIILSFRTFGPP